MFTDIAVRLAQMGFDCARGNIQKFGYFLVCQPVKPAQTIDPASYRRH